MQTVSADWKTAQTQNFLPESKVKITVITDGDAGVNDDVSTSDGTITPYNSVLLSHNAPNVYASAEQNSWPVNGTIPIYNTNLMSPYNYDGFLSTAFSQSDATFSSPVELTVVLNPARSKLSGITITWSKAFNEMANTFTVTAKNGGTTVATKTITGNTATTTLVGLNVTSTIDSIVISIAEWCLPYCQAKIESVILGAEFIFTNDEILNFTHSQFGDLCSLRLPCSKASWTVNNLTDEWSPLNPDGHSDWLVKGEKVIISYGYVLNGSVEWIDCGTFFLTDWGVNSDGLSAYFEAVDIIQMLTNPYTSLSGTGNYTVKQFAEYVLQDAGLTSSQYDISGLSTYYTLTLPEYNFDGLTAAEALQLCANLSKCVMYVDRTGKIQIKSRDTTLKSYQINLDNSWDFATIERLEPLKYVRVYYSTTQYNTTSALTPVGVAEVIQNPIIMKTLNSSLASDVGDWIEGVLEKNVTISGEWRPDVRLDVFDYITVISKYATSKVVITEFEYNYNGAFHGTYKGRVFA